MPENAKQTLINYTQPHPEIWTALYQKGLLEDSVAEEFYMVPKVTKLKTKDGLDKAREYHCGLPVACWSG